MRISLLFFLALYIFLPSALGQTQGYFQQKVNTQIKVSLNDVSHVLSGHIRMNYTNNSPDTLRFIYFHLYPNAYKNNQTAYAKQMLANADNSFAKLAPSERGYIDSLKFEVDGVIAQLQSTSDIDVVKILLPQPLLPAQNITIQTPFRVKLPYMTSRLGHVGQSYQITQWFPKPAVYDQEGWHEFPYLNYGEYYSEFGSYTVDITLPANYIVMATGNIATPSEQEWLDSLCALPIDAFPNKATTIASSDAYKTIRFEEDNIHDFAWFASKNWVVRKETFKLPENKNLIAAYSAYFKDDDASFKNSVHYLKATVLGYSSRIGPYPYKTVKSVAGPIAAGGGMEYPTITIIDAFKSENTVKQVIVHEVGHNWFYGIFGTNERRYPFMDESINSFFEQLIIEEIDATKGIKATPQGAFTEMLAVNALSGANKTVPLCMHSNHYKEINYGLDIYTKGAAYFRWLAAYMGNENFFNGMRQYYETWKFKHPQPEDMMQALQAHSPKHLNWFLDDAVKMPLLPEFKLKSFNKEKNQVTVVNKSPYSLPASVVIINGSDTSAPIWTPPFKGKHNLNIDAAHKASFVLLDKTIPDEQFYNNSTQKSFGLKPFASLSLKPKYNLYASPALGYNTYDQFLIGAILHNMTLPSKNLEFAIAPMYGLGSNKFAYTGFVNYFWRVNNSTIKDISFELNSKRFSEADAVLFDDLHTQYWKNKLGVTFNFTPKTYSSAITQQLSVNFYNIRRTQVVFESDTNGNVTGYRTNGWHDDYFMQVAYVIKNEAKFYPYSLAISGVANKNFAQLHIDARYKINYNASKKGINLRFFGGAVIGNQQRRPAFAALNITGSGWTDYLYDHTFVGRTERSGFWSNQSVLSQGGFYSHTQQMAVPIGRSESYLIAFNTDIEIPKTPLSVFGNIAYSKLDPLVKQGLGISEWQFEAGIALHVLKRFTIALPILLSSDLNDNRNFNLGKNKILKTVSFRMDLSNLTPTRKMVSTFL